MAILDREPDHAHTESVGALVDRSLDHAEGALVAQVPHVRGHAQCDVRWGGPGKNRARAVRDPRVGALGAARTRPAATPPGPGRSLSRHLNMANISDGCGQAANAATCP